MSSQELIRAEVNKLIQFNKDNLKTVQKVALDQAWKLLQLATASIVQMIESMGTDLSNPDKKALAMELLNNYYDKVFIVIDIPFVPGFLEPIIHKYIKSLLMILLSASIDATVTIFKNTGVFLKKEAGL